MRGSYSEVFRVPTINDLYQAPGLERLAVQRSVRRLDGGSRAGEPEPRARLRKRAPRTAPSSSRTRRSTACWSATTDLKPETGDVITYGFVYDPSWLPGLSMNVDFWDYSLEDVITQLDVNTIADQCVGDRRPDSSAT